MQAYERPACSLQGVRRDANSQHRPKILNVGAGLGFRVQAYIVINILLLVFLYSLWFFV